MTAMDTKTVASEIDKFLEHEGLEPDKCVGQGYGGCSTKAGNIGGVQKILKRNIKKPCIFIAHATELSWS